MKWRSPQAISICPIITKRLEKTMEEKNSPELANDNNDAGNRERDLPPAALRALKEAEERRKAAEKAAVPREIGGRGGPDPARFGDWEIKGRAIDF
jgi:hypothetical protein